jgi:hypothetical protein
LDTQNITIKTTATADTTPTIMYPIFLTVQKVFFPGAGEFPFVTSEDFVGSFEGTRPVVGDSDGDGAGPAGSGDGAMLVLNGLPSLLCSRINLLSINKVKFLV